MQQASLQTADEWLHTLETSLAEVRFRGTSASVHELRVAAQRLSVWLELAGRRALRDDLRWLRRLAGELRDLDVAAEGATARTRGGKARAGKARAGTRRAGTGRGRSARAREAAASERRRALETLRRELSAPRVDDVLRALHLASPFHPPRARRVAERLARRVRVAGERLSADPTDPANLHRMRRRVRRLRYALEWLEQDCRPLVELQEALGNVQNLVVCGLWLPADQAAAQAARRRIARAIEHARVRALALWGSLEPTLEEICTWKSA